MAWDKIFPLSDKVIHEKVSYPNRFGIEIAADMYKPKDFDASRKYAAILVGTPYGGVKEQGAGIYAQTMAETLGCNLVGSPGSRLFDVGHPGRPGQLGHGSPRWRSIGRHAAPWIFHPDDA